MSDGNNTVKKKNWFVRHKVLTAILVLIILVAIGGASSSNKNTTSNTATTAKTSTKAKQYRFADRADKQPKDLEILPGESATISGVKMTPSNVAYATQLGEFETADQGKTYVSADVTLENTSTRTQPYNVFDFRIQTAGGQVLDGAIVAEPNLSSGDLVAGGKAQGKIYFQVPVENGHEYIIWKPGVSSDRAIVQVK